MQQLILTNKLILNVSKIISTVTDPKMTFLYVYAYIVFYKFESLAIAIFTFAFLIISFLISKLAFRTNNNTDTFKFDNKLHRRNRYTTYLLMLIVTSLLLLFSVLLDKNIEKEFLVIALIDSIILFILAFLFNLKLSAHISYLGLFILYFWQTSFDKYWLFIIASIVVGLSRLILRKHNLYQLLQAFSIIIFLYIIFDIL